ncbi:MAG TPA: lysophospholipid acyltransferase family protein [Candidatus Acidoferrales bacterium]|nr:lysophospholipid acyltransferase family protein [Candidatus Acidoferrales bacterium]
MGRKRIRSSLKQFFYGLRYRIGEYALRSFSVVIQWIPYRLLVIYTLAMAKVTFTLLWKYRRRMEENVAMALGDSIGRPERKALVWRAWKNFARGVLDTAAIMHFPKEKIIATMPLQGEEHLKRALAKGKGVLALSAHLGPFTMIGGRLAASGYPFSAVVKHPRDERFARVIDGYRAQLGIQTISARPRREAVRGILKALRNNRIVLIIADEFKSGGVMVNFMGQSSPAPRGPASLALRTGAATLPVFATRQPDGSLTLSIGPEIEPVPDDDLEQSVAATTALYTRHIEEVIYRYPDQWNWLGFPRNGRIPRSEIGRPPEPLPSERSPITAEHRVEANSREENAES